MFMGLWELLIYYLRWYVLEMGKPLSVTHRNIPFLGLISRWSPYE